MFLQNYFHILYQWNLSRQKLCNRKDSFNLLDSLKDKWENDLRSWIKWEKDHLVWWRLLGIDRLVKKWLLKRSKWALRMKESQTQLWDKFLFSSPWSILTLSSTQYTIETELSFLWPRALSVVVLAWVSPQQSPWADQGKASFESTTDQGKYQSK